MQMETVIICGPQASGKSSIVKEFPNHTRLNRDTIGGKMQGLEKLMEEALSKGKDVVLDNTFCTSEDREPFIKIAKKYNSIIKCIYMDTSVEDCLINACVRMIENYGKIPKNIEDDKSKHPDMFPPAPIYKYFKRVNKPSKDEGFDSLEFRKFSRQWPKYLKNKAIIFDYDGTLRYTNGGNGKYPTCEEEQGYYTNRHEVIKKYKEQGYILLGASNQSGIAKGHLTEDMAKKLFDLTNKNIGFDIEYSFCPHSVPPIKCYCRKPGPAMGVEFIFKHNLNPSETIMVGDMKTDETFAKRLGFKFIHVDNFFKE